MVLRSRSVEAPAMTLEGVLGPNDRLELAPAVSVPSPDALAIAADGALLVSSGAEILRLSRWGGEFAAWAHFPAPVTALAASPGGLVAVGLSGGGLKVLTAAGEPAPGWGLSDRLHAVVDCLFLSEDELALVDPGYGPDEPVLSVAPWDTNARGQVVALSKAGQTRRIAAGLHCPMGIAVASDGGLVISEMERARLLATDGRVRQAGYPGYLGRIRRVGDGYALACLSRRDPLIEFLKTERNFIAAMKATIDPRHWIAPRATPEFAHDSPIELGATRLFGEVKPWAPSFSYGLVIELDGALMPTGSAQSRANGSRHAITDVVSWNGDLIVTSRASGELINLGGQGAPA